MLPVAGVPVIGHQLSRLKAAGVDRVVLATSYRPEVFADYIGDGSDFGLHVVHVTEVDPLGTGGGIRNVVGELQAGPDDPVVVLNGDIFSAHDIGAQIALHISVRAAATLHLTLVEDPSAFGSVPTDGDGRVTAFLEKAPEPVTNQINAGCYVFRRSVIDAIPAGRPVSVERETFPALLAAGERLQGYIEAAYWLDLGAPASYLQANRDVVLLRGETSLVMVGAEVAADVVLTNGTTIGTGATVDGGSVIDGSVVLDGASIGLRASITGSVVGRGVVLGDECVLDGAVIGDEAKIGDRNELLHGIRVWPGVEIPGASLRFSTDA
ncbi:MAG: mannose-phosphate guanylyltransferase [Frankiales bacterium]|jgi:mannose-1-phosphate guanylyltransferase|nr:mannose-phosphate guanylyltransferase [Frankiales bacterium]